MVTATDNPQWADILHELAKHEMDFLVVGGAALVLHGIPRTTIDIDIYVPADTAGIRELFDLLENTLGLESRASSISSLLQFPDLISGQWIPFSIPNGPDIIDIYLCRSGEYYSLAKDAEHVEVFDNEVSVAGVDTLRKMKEECGRAVDLADIALIDEYKSLLDE